MDDRVYLVNENTPATSAGWYPAKVARVLLGQANGWSETEPPPPPVKAPARAAKPVAVGTAAAAAPEIAPELDVPPPAGESTPDGGNAANPKE